MASQNGAVVALGTTSAAFAWHRSAPLARSVDTWSQLCKVGNTAASRKGDAT